MGKAITIIVKEGQNVISSNTVTEGSGKPLVIKAKPGHSYELKNMTKGVAPDQIYVVRDGENLKIKIGKKAKHSDNSDKSDDNADIIIEAYFEHDCNLIGAAENGQYYNYIPQGADPEASYYSLGGETLVSETETDWLPIILGTLGAGAIAAAAGGGGGGDTPPPEPYPPADTTPPESLTVTVYDDMKDPDSIIVSTEKGTISIESDPGSPVTNDNTPTIKGRTEAGATVTARDDKGNLLGTVTADIEGSYTITIDATTPLSEGQHYVSVTATDSAGNAITVSSGIFTIDTQAPDAPELNPTDGSPITGTAEPGSTVTISYNDGTEIITETTTADDYGNFIYTPVTPVPDGTEIAATARDAAGNESQPDTTTVNAALEDAPIVYDDVAPLIGLVSDGATTNDARPEFKGVLDPANEGSTIKVYDNGTFLGETEIQTDGSWSLTPESGLSEGTHTITYTKDDGSPSPATLFTVDTAAPDITMTLTDNAGDERGPIANNGFTDDATPTIRGKTEPGATVTIKDGNTVLHTVTADGSGNYTWTPDDPLSIDQHTITATATDAAGNSNTASTTFSIEPPAVIDLGDDGQLINPVFVDGNYYYYWDKDGDGTGIDNGNPDLDDWFTHDELDDIFMYDIDGNQGEDYLGETTDAYRYAELGGYNVALPTYGGDTDNDHTQVPTDTAYGEDNPYYDDLVAIWDAFERGTNLTAENGTPPEWANGIYWSATQYNDSRHYSMDMTNGHGATNAESNQSYVAVQVIF